MPQELWLYYFSGTGNARRACEWIAENAQQRGIAACLIDISTLRGKPVQCAPENVMIGFAGPTHGFNFPPILLKFLNRFPRGHNSIFILNTRGGLKAGKLFIPGLSGLAQWYAAAVLKMKGYQIIGMRPVDLPSNWISLHPALREKAVIAIHKRWKKKIGEFCDKIFSGKKDMSAMRDIIQDVLVSPISILYFIIGRFFLAKSFIATSQCNACGLCVEQCPVKALSWVGKRPFWSVRCESCMHCINMCPQQAIQTAHGFFIGSLWLLITIFTTFVFERLFPNVHGIWANDFIQFSLISIVIFPIFLLMYKIMYTFFRISFFEKCISLTSLTFYKFWGRYKITKQMKLKIEQEEI